MDWILSSTTVDLATWEALPFSRGVEFGPRPGDKRDVHERVVGFERPGPPIADGFARRMADAILRFDVFPPRLLASVLRRRPVELGDTVGLRYFLAPGLHVFFAARVMDRFEETTANQWRCGFTYRTLQGHPACGEETFVVEKELGTGLVTVALRSWSRPGIWIARLTYPVMRLLQIRAARAALDHLENLAGGALTNMSIPATASGARRNLRTGFFAE